MPTIGTFHTFYWEFSDTNVTPASVGTVGYPLWQANVIIPSLFGIIGAWIDTWLARLKWWKGFAPRVHRLTPGQRQVLVTTLGLLESPLYPHAKHAVSETAKTLGFNRPEGWREYARMLKDDHGRAENVFRHVRAMQLTERYANSTLQNPPLNLITELAYHEYAWKPWT